MIPFKPKPKKKNVKTVDKPLKGFVGVTRVYGEKGKKQPIFLALSSVESVRPRNKLKNHRTTIKLKSGAYINVAEKFSEVHELLASAASR